MNYEPLAKLYYKDKSVYTKIYNERFNNEFSYHLPFEISGNKAFFIIDYQISRKIEEIYYISRQLDDILNQLPPIAFKYYINKNLIDEIMLTNDIEGVYSTRKEISQIIEMPDNSTKKVRLMGLVKKYQKLIMVKKFLSQAAMIYDFCLMKSFLTKLRKMKNQMEKFLERGQFLYVQRQIKKNIVDYIQKKID